MTDASTYTPPNVWQWDMESGGKFSNINRPIAGATHEKELPVGDHPLQLYSLATPNGVKVTVLLEELLALGKHDAEYNAYPIHIGEGEQFGSGYGHFYAYAPEKLEYPINRYTMEVKRQLDVLDRNLSSRRYLCGDEYTIADMATYPWYGSLVMGTLYEAQEFLDVGSYSHVIRWASEVHARPAVQRGRRVNRAWGPEEEQLLERHASSDLD